MDRIARIPLVWDNVLDRLSLKKQIEASLVNQQFRQSASDYVDSRGIVIDDSNLEEPPKCQNEEEWIHHLLKNSLLESKHVRVIKLTRRVGWSQRLLEQLIKDISLSRLKKLSINCQVPESKNILSRMVPLMTSLKSLRAETNKWLDVEKQVLELINRQSFTHLELVLFSEENCIHLLSSLDSNEALRSKLKTLEDRNGMRSVGVEQFKRMLSLIISVRSMRIFIDRWLYYKEDIIQLVGRSGFKRLELIIGNNDNCDDLLFTIESNANLRLKLKALV